MGILNAISNAIVAANGVLWGWLLAGVLLAMGLVYTIALHAPQIRYFPKLFSSLKSSFKSEGGGVSGFGALCAAVGGQVGTGSLVGVASAITAGGPGAVFWMWVTALFGMALSFGECTLGQLFRERNEDGSYRGGPAYYMKKGMHSKLMAGIYSFLMIFSVGFCVAMIQSNSIASSINMVATSIDPIIPGIIIAILTGLVAFGGVKRLSDVSSFIVPFMAIGYILFTLYIILTHLSALPGVISMIFRCAFSVEAVGGGVVGYTIKEAFRNGVARGLFSNDAGNGAAAGMHASAEVKHPITQGFCAMLGTFLTTIIICSCTAFAILITGSTATGMDGINLVQAAFASVLGPVGTWVVMLAMILFGFTTLLADVYYGEINVKYVFGEKRKALVWIFRVVALVLVAIAAVIPLNALWNMVDFVAALIVFLNVTALAFMLKYVRYVFKDYTRQIRQGIREPVWDRSVDVTELDLSKPVEDQIQK